MSKTFSTAIELRFSDLDLYGHVNSVVYFSYLETARVRVMSNEFRELTEKGIFLLVAHAECDYIRPILFEDSVAVSFSVSRVGGSSFDLSYSIHDDSGKPYATAKTVMVCYDNKIGKTIEVPEILIDLAGAS